MTSTSTVSRRRRVVAAAFAACLVTGAGAVAFGGGTTATQPESAPTTGSTVATLSASRPVRIRIDRLDVAARVRVLEAAGDGSTAAKATSAVNSTEVAAAWSRPAATG